MLSMYVFVCCFALLIPLSFLYFVSDLPVLKVGLLS